MVMRNRNRFKLFVAAAALLVAACTTPSKPVQDHLIDTPPLWIHLPETTRPPTRRLPS
jgi:hypothetical protein